MTNEEALALIKRYDRAWVVRNSHTGEVIAVSDAGKEADDFNKHILGLKSFGSPVTGNVIRSAEATLDTVENFQREATRVRERKRILAQWESAPFETMVSFL